MDLSTPGAHDSCFHFLEPGCIIWRNWTLHMHPSAHCDSGTTRTLLTSRSGPTSAPHRYWNVPGRKNWPRWGWRSSDPSFPNARTCVMQPALTQPKLKATSLTAPQHSASLKTWKRFSYKRSRGKRDVWSVVYFQEWRALWNIFRKVQILSLFLAHERACCHSNTAMAGITLTDAAAACFSSVAVQHPT